MTIGSQIYNLPHRVPDHLQMVLTNPPGTGPGKFLWRSRKTGAYRIHFDITADSLKLLVVTNEPIVTFILPEWLSSSV